MENLLENTQKEEMYKQIVDYSFETTVIHSNQQILYINEAGAAFLGAESKEELIGASVVDVFTEEYKDFIIERIRKGEEDKKVGELVETKVYRLDGSVVDVELFCHPVIYGETQAMQSIMRDITQRKEAEEKLVTIMTPVVPISEATAVIPLVGYIDEDRSNQLLEALPSKIQDEEADNIIVDVSGIYSIDVVGLEFLRKLHSILTLIGVSPIYTGIRADLAQQLVNNYGNNEITNMKTMANVKQALNQLK